MTVDIIMSEKRLKVISGMLALSYRLVIVIMRLTLASILRKTWVVVCLVVPYIVSPINGGNNPVKKRVCVIGAGPSGLLSAKTLAENLEELEPIVFEKNSDVGGNWIYTDNGDVDEYGLPVHSGIYKSLRVTTPKETMACPDFEFRGGSRSCVGHEAVLEYLRNYTSNFNLRKYIKFNTLVEKVIPLPKDTDWRKTKWLVNTRNLNTNSTSKTTCDFIMVCNGHEYKPLIPDIPGIETFPGRILHSHSYRTPDGFSNQTIVILGASISGQELSFELGDYADTIYLSHRHEKINIEMPKNVIQVPGVIAANGRKLILQDGSTIEADSFIFCTGYKTDIPFLEANSGLEVLKEKYVYPLYKQIVNVEYPTMGFVGFPSSISHFCPKFHSSANYYVSLINGKAELPDRDEMLKDAELMLSGSPEMHTPNWQWIYLTGLAEDGNFKRLDDFYRRAFDLWLYHRDHNLRHYKEYDLRTLDDGSIVIVKSENDLIVL